MIRLILEPKRDRELEILCLGAHSDDIEIGCGGTILMLAEQNPKCTFHWVVFSALGVREPEARRAADLFAGTRLKGPILKSFRDGFMPYVGGEVKKIFEGLNEETSPDVVLTHYGKDAHQDHRLLSELTWNTFRDHLILEYEIPKYDGDLGTPNVFVPVSEEISKKKSEFLMNAFESQRAKHWFQESTFSALMRLRGMECHSPSGYAEAFYCRKVILA
jgi:LmbE family N-acetylglucosaminyl deacetylase